MKKMNRLITGVLSLVMMATPVYASEPSSWAAEEVNKAVEIEIVTEKVTDEYQQEITREEFAELLVLSYEQLSGLPINIDKVDNPFTDTSNELVIKALSKGFVSGTSDTTFSPEEGLSREAMTVMLIRMYENLEVYLKKEILISSETDVQFVDSSDISEWALKSIDIAYNNDIISGYDDGSFHPKAKVTKEQSIIINYRAYMHAVEQLGIKLEETDATTEKETGKNAIKEESEKDEMTLVTASKNDKEDEAHEGYVNCSALNFRSSPNTDSKDNIIDKLYQAQQVKILDAENDWLYVEDSNGTEGYVHSDYITIVKAYKDSEDNSDVAARREEIVEYAKQFVGLPYVYGGNSLKTGTDCSGFVHLIYKHFDYNINRTATSQTKNGIYVPKDELLPGDLVMYGYNGRIDHVAMYIGNGKVIHEGNRSTGVFINDVFSSWNHNYITSRRIIN